MKGFTLTPGNGAYLEASMAFNPALAYGFADARPWPTVWMQDVAGTLALLNGTSQAHFIEYDIIEASPIAVGTIRSDMNDHDWTTVGTTATNNYINHQPAITVGTGFNDYAMLWKTIAGGGGLVQRFFNQGAVASTTYSAGAGSIPAASPSNSNGVFSAGDSENFVLMICAGVNWPVQFDYVAVWQ
jgi:hypothetical protein